MQDFEPALLASISSSMYDDALAEGKTYTISCSSQGHQFQAKAFNFK